MLKSAASPAATECLREPRFLAQAGLQRNTQYGNSSRPEEDCAVGEIRVNDDPTII